MEHQKILFNEPKDSKFEKIRHCPCSIKDEL